MSRLLYYGGTFNPPHLGHQSVIKQCIDTFDFDHLIVSPIYNTHHKQSNNTNIYSHILKMIDIMLLEIYDTYNRIRVLDNSGSQVSSYTYEILNEIVLPEYNPDEVIIVGGTDLIEEIPNWYKYDFLIHEFSFMFFNRYIPISSTVIRNDIKKYKYHDIHDYMREDIIRYIRDNNLYEGDN